jgi:hypothetical protein
VAGEGLLVAAETAEREQRRYLSASVVQLYQCNLEANVEARHEQVGRLEEQLENRIA